MDTTAPECIMPYDLPVDSAAVGTVDWGDGTTDELPVRRHTYASPGTYHVQFTGTTDTYGALKNSQRCLVSVEKMDLPAAGTTSLWRAFARAKNLVSIPSDIDTSGVVSMADMFYGASKFNQPLTFDTSSVTDMSYMFRDALAFDQPLNFNTSNVTDMQGMFRMFSPQAQFNQPLNFNTSNVTNMSYMFSGGTFNQDISGWDTGNVTNMSYMFSEASSFDQDISGWDTGNVTNMAHLFAKASSFNQDISGWDTGNVTDMTSLFSLASSFNQNLSGWDVANVANHASFDFGANAWAEIYKPQF